jgi:hypothetical protein
MSALPPKADIGSFDRDVGFVLLSGRRPLLDQRSRKLSCEYLASGDSR